MKDRRGFEEATYSRGHLEIAVYRRLEKESCEEQNKDSDFCSL